MTYKLRIDAVSCCVPYRYVLSEPKDLYAAQRLIDGVPELAARLLSHVECSSDADLTLALLDAMATIDVLCDEVIALEDRLENAAYADDTIW